jgi:hypothetical protein
MFVVFLGKPIPHQSLPRTGLFALGALCKTNIELRVCTNGRLELTARRELVQRVLPQRLQQSEARFPSHPRLLDDQAGVEEIAHHVQYVDLAGPIAHAYRSRRGEGETTREDAESAEDRLSVRTE